jgi:hypothetical protein
MLCATQIACICVRTFKAASVLDAAFIQVGALIGRHLERNATLTLLDIRY